MASTGSSSLVGSTSVNFVKAAISRFFGSIAAAKPSVPVNPGIYNVGNSCFLNSVIQSLASLDSIHPYMNNMNGDVSLALRESLKAMCLESENTHNTPVARLSAIQDKFLRYRDPQDAHELMQFLVNLIDEQQNNLKNDNIGMNCLTKKKKYETSPTKPIIIKKYNENTIIPNDKPIGPSPPPPNSSTPSNSPNSLEMYNSMDSFISPKCRTSEITLEIDLKSEEPHFCKKYFDPPGLGDKEKNNSNLTKTPSLDKLASLFDTNPFCGLFASTVTCLKCGTKSISYQKFIDLSLTISPNRNTLENCLEDFVNAEQIKEAECPNPQNCNLNNFNNNMHDSLSHFLNGSKIKKSLSVSKLPNNLFIHLKRLTSGYSGIIKDNTFVEFPFILDMEPYCHKYETNLTKKNNNILNPMNKIIGVQKKSTNFSKNESSMLFESNFNSPMSHLVNNNNEIKDQQNNSSK